MVSYILDQALADFSKALSMKQVPSYPKGNLIETDEDVNLILTILEKEIFPPLHM